VTNFDESNDDVSDVEDVEDTSNETHLVFSPDPLCDKSVYQVNPETDKVTVNIDLSKNKSKYRITASIICHNTINPWCLICKHWSK